MLEVRLERKQTPLAFYADYLAFFFPTPFTPYATDLQAAWFRMLGCMTAKLPRPCPGPVYISAAEGYNRRLRSPLARTCLPPSASASRWACASRYEVETSDDSILRSWLLEYSQEANFAFVT